MSGDDGVDALRELVAPPSPSPFVSSSADIGGTGGVPPHTHHAGGGGGGGGGLSPASSRSSTGSSAGDHRGGSFSGGSRAAELRRAAAAAGMQQQRAEAAAAVGGGGVGVGVGVGGSRGGGGGGGGGGVMVDEQTALFSANHDGPRHHHHGDDSDDIVDDGYTHSRRGRASGHHHHESGSLWASHGYDATVLIGGPWAQVQLAASVAAMVASMALFLWAYVNTVKGGYFDYGLFSLPPVFVGGVTGAWAHSGRTRMWTAVHVVVVALASQGVILSYGAGVGLKGLTQVKWLIPVLLWALLAAVQLLAAVMAGARDLSPRRYRPTPFGRTGRILLGVSALYALASAVFFLWAGINTINMIAAKQKGADVGLICFMVSFVAGVCGLYGACSRTTGRAMVQIIVTAIAGATVAASYATAIIIAPVPSHTKIGWGVACAIWVAASLVVIGAAAMHRKAILRAAASTSEWE